MTTPSPEDHAPWRVLATLSLALVAWWGISVSVVSAQTSDTTTYNLPFPHDNGDMFNPSEFPGGVSLQWPSNFNYGVVYNPLTGMYEVQQTIGDTLAFREQLYLHKSLNCSYALAVHSNIADDNFVASICCNPH